MISCIVGKIQTIVAMLWKNFTDEKRVSEVQVEYVYIAGYMRHKNLGRSGIMRYTFTGTNIQVTEALRDTAMAKISKLDKYFSDETEVHVTMRVLKKNQIIEVSIPIKGSVIRAEESAESMYAAIDNVIDVLERQILKHKKKIVDRHRHSGKLAKDFAESLHDEDEGITITRSKRFAVKPMDPEEACMEMDLLGHDFFVFRNSETDEVNVVYKRKDGKFGWIEPQ